MTIYHPRSEAVQRAYEAFIETNDARAFDLHNETIIREYDHWVIIENRFPYDNMTRVNHLLVSREPLADLPAASSAVRAEYEQIMAALATDGLYDAKIENFPSATSVKNHYHLHLVCWHNHRA